MRYNADGSLVRTFGGDGVVVIDVSSAREVEALPDDLWVVPVSNPSASWRLTNTPDRQEGSPSWCGDDLYDVYRAPGSARNATYMIWRVDSNGANPTELGEMRRTEDQPDCKF